MGKPSFDTNRHVQSPRAAAPGRLPGREIPRRPRKKISLWRHIFGALALCVTLGIAVVLLVDIYGDPKDAVPEQRVGLSAPPPAPAFDSLNGDSDTLPDLLSDVAAGENPTEAIAQQQRLDALGNPIGNPANNSGDAANGPDIMAGSNGSGAPSVGDITINGQSIGSGLIKAPAAGLSKNTPFGPIPAPAADGRTAFNVYARPYTAAANANPVSLVIGGLGINRTLTERAINELPSEVTLSFAAHAPNLQSQIDLARARGHEVLLELPLESAEFDASEPGAEWALRTGSDAATQNKRNLDRLLSRASGYFAVTNYNGGLFLQRSDSVVPMMAALSDAGLGFVFDGSITAPSLPTLASASRLPYLKAFSLIDSNPDSASITAELDRIAQLGSSGAAPVGFGFTYPQTIDAVAEWTKGLERQGLTLAPVSSRMPAN